MCEYEKVLNLNLSEYKSSYLVILFKIDLTEKSKYVLPSAYTLKCIMYV